jgi:tetratricopeptide (TPR) repeat protein
VELKQHQKALEYFAQAIAVDPNNALVYYNRSSALHGVGDKQAAIADLEKCLTFNPEERFRQAVSRKLEFLRASP